VPALNKLMLRSMDDPNVDRPRDPSTLVYVPESQAERAARAGRMSSPLRRGAHESWWSAEQGWFNAVAKSIPTYRVLDEEGRVVRGGKVPQITKEEALKMWVVVAA
jgi:2-oxoisovalerate dehydrogenase E1 component alpha subunit